MAATQTFADLLHLKSDQAESLGFLGEAGYLWWYLGRRDKAIAIFEALKLLAPNDPVGYLGCAEILIEKGDFKEAERVAGQAARTANINRRTLAFAHIIRGQAMLGLKNPAEAEKAWRKACDVDPDGAIAQTTTARTESARLCGLLPSAK